VATAWEAVIRWAPIAICSLHSLARRIERGEDRTHDALLADLAALVDADPDADQVAAGDGFWIGPVIGMRGPNDRSWVRSVRTFHC
jgi:hypothetical protein